MLLPAIFYIVWDAWFTRLGVWSFNGDYIRNIHLYNLPIEEVLFFFVVPYCCVFIYECIRCYFPGLKDGVVSTGIFAIIALLLLVTAFLHADKLYTFFTSVFCAIFMALVIFFRKQWLFFQIKAFLVSYLIILFPFLLVNGFLTAIPVVLYNDDENVGLRLYTIPVEDIFYGMLLIMLNIAGYEFRKSKALQQASIN